MLFNLRKYLKASLTWILAPGPINLNHVVCLGVDIISQRDRDSGIPGKLWNCLTGLSEYEDCGILDKLLIFTMENGPRAWENGWPFLWRPFFCKVGSETAPVFFSVLSWGSQHWILCVTAAWKAWSTILYFLFVCLLNRSLALTSSKVKVIHFGKEQHVGFTKAVFNLWLTSKTCALNYGLGYQCWYLEFVLWFWDIQICSVTLCISIHINHCVYFGLWMYVPFWKVRTPI